MAAEELRFRAMGTIVHVVVVRGCTGTLAAAQARVADLERRWSRFLPGSEVSRMNAAAGRPVVVSEETVELVDRSLRAWAATGGAFDPTLLHEITALGYDRPFEELGRAPQAARPGAAPRRRCDGPHPAAAVVVQTALRSVELPPGAGFDPGGIGKGLAADIVVREAAGAAVGICVNIGGDLVVAGEPPGPDGWVVEVADPWDGPPRAVLALEAGAVATTSCTRRRWWMDGRERHHVLHPRTGLPAETGLASVTAVAGEGWWAEAAAKAAFLAGPEGAADVLAALGGSGILVDDRGELHVTDDVREGAR